MTRRSPRQSRLWLVAIAPLFVGCGDPDAPVVPVPTTITIDGAPATLDLTDTKQLTVKVLDQLGAAMPDSGTTWKSTDPLVLAVSGTGLITAQLPGPASITAKKGTVSATVKVDVLAPPKSIALVNGDNQAAGIGAAVPVRPSVVVRDARGNAVSGVTVTFSVDQGGGQVTTGVAATTTAGGIAQVDSWKVGPNTGTNGLTASIAGTGITGNPAHFTATAVNPPVIQSVSPTTLVPGATVTITGLNFLPSTTVNIGGDVAPVTSSTATQVVATVPCVSNGATSVIVSTYGTVPSASFAHTVTTAQRTLAVGQAFIGTSGAVSTCNELVTTGSSARYIVAVFNSSTSQNTVLDFQLTGNPAAPGSAAVQVVAGPRAHADVAPRTDDIDAIRDRAHWQMLERDRAEYERLRAITMARPAAAEARAQPGPTLPGPSVGDTRNLYYTFDGGCNDVSKVIQGKLIYAGTYAVIWEDQANPIQSSSNSTVLGYYQRVGQIFDADQYTSLKNTFGDPLRRDAVTDNDGKVHMIFTTRLNGSGAAAYVTSCDQFPTSTSPGSNFGQFFYGMAPTTAALNLNSANSPDGWFYFMARTIVHEVKHIASLSARVANSSPSFEQSWLEEGTARHAEEVWVRDYLHHVAWKGNTGWGTAATNTVFCDFHPENATCNAADPLRRPSYGVRRQLNEIRPKLVDPWDWSPYGDGLTQSGASVFYQTCWSLVRYTIDRYATSDAAFFNALINSTTTGTTNLSTVAGVPMDQLIGGWGLSLYADDFPGLVSPSPDIQFPTWNLRSIYAGLNLDPTWSTTWPAPFPILPSQFSFGPFAMSLSGLRGGAHAYFEISGAPQKQILALRGLTGGVPSSLVRIAVARIQ